VSSANQYPVDDTYPYYITSTSFETYRNRRINKVLSESSSITVDDMMKLQNDNFNVKASESLPFMLEQLDSATLSPEEKKAWDILKSWDYYNSKESEGASYYEAWWNNLMPLIWDELKREKIVLSRPTSFNTIRLIKEKPDFVFFDVEGTQKKETASDLIHSAFTFAVEDMGDWIAEHSDSTQGGTAIATPKWADYKDSYLTHLLRLDPMSIHLRAGGGRDMVNAHSRTHGPSWRMVVSLEKSGVRVWGTYPGGQSGNPGSPHYIDMLARWLDGKYFSLNFPKTVQEAEKIGSHSITLTSTGP
jgi:penicillin amidase